PWAGTAESCFYRFVSNRLVALCINPCCFCSISNIDNKKYKVKMFKKNLQTAKYTVKLSVSGFLGRRDGYSTLCVLPVGRRSTYPLVYKNGDFLAASRGPRHSHNRSIPIDRSVCLRVY